jgi:hypothetical protein
MLYLLLAVVSLAITAVSFYMYVQPPPTGGSTLYLIGIIVFLIATLASGGMFFSGRVNKTDDIHITE